MEIRRWSGVSRRGPKIPPVVLTDAEREKLQSWVHRRSSAQSFALRSRIVLECADGHAITEVARRLRVTPGTVSTWRRRFLERRLSGLEPLPSVRQKITEADVERVIVKTLEEKPMNATHWSTRSMAAATGMSQSAICRIWRAFCLQPHRAETFEGPLFVRHVRNVVGLYIDQPERALVLRMDEKSEIQNLHPSQPVLPMLVVPERRSHDQVRADTTTHFAADTAAGKVVGSLHPQYRVTEFKKFLIKLDREVPAGIDVHLVLDNYVTYRVPAIKNWLVTHPRFHLHFTPTGSSWLRRVERWFDELTATKLERGGHLSGQSLDRDIGSLPGSCQVWP